ncbi:MAG: hypothetical protein IKS12_03525, partial [Eubacterium sp.]|nr:hypothetical protein [Eubacterium sp.]
MRKDLSNNFKSSFIYIIIPLVLIGLVFFMSSQNKAPDMKYSQVVELFTTDQVSEFEIDLSSGALRYKLFKDDDKTPLHTYSVPSVTYFIDDISPSVQKYNKLNPNKKIVYNYKKGSGSSIFMSLLPTLLLVLIIGGFSFWMIRRMSSTIGGENNRALGFGKIKPKTHPDNEK